MATKDIYEMWYAAVESAMQKAHSPEKIRDVDLRKVNGMMVHTGIKSGVELLSTGGPNTEGLTTLSSYESGACGSYASGACVSYASGACLSGPLQPE